MNDGRAILKVKILNICSMIVEREPCSPWLAGQAHSTCNTLAKMKASCVAHSRLYNFIFVLFLTIMNSH